MPAQTTRATSLPANVVPSTRFVGTVQAHNLEAQVTALACQSAGDIIMLSIVGPRTTVSAIAATLHKGGRTRQPILFHPTSPQIWYGPEQLYRMQAMGSGWMASAVEPTTHLNVAVLAHAANIAYCRAHPIPQPEKDPESSPSPPHQPGAERARKRAIPAPRFVLASEGADHPDWMTFTGLMRSLWLPFPLSFAPFIWEAGRAWHFEVAPFETTDLDMEREHTLIEPVACALGIQAWQIIPSRQWETLLEHETPRIAISMPL